MEYPFLEPAIFTDPQQRSPKEPNFTGNTINMITLYIFLYVWMKILHVCSYVAQFSKQLILVSIELNSREKSSLIISKIQNAHTIHFLLPSRIQIYKIFSFIKEGNL